MKINLKTILKRPFKLKSRYHPLMLIVIKKLPLILRNLLISFRELIFLKRQNVQVFLHSFWKTTSWETTSFNYRKIKIPLGENQDQWQSIKITRSLTNSYSKLKKMLWKFIQENTRTEILVVLNSAGWKLHKSLKIFLKISQKRKII